MKPEREHCTADCVATEHAARAERSHRNVCRHLRMACRDAGVPEAFELLCESGASGGTPSCWPTTSRVVPPPTGPEEGPKLAMVGAKKV